MDDLVLVLVDGSVLLQFLHCTLEMAAGKASGIPRFFASFITCKIAQTTNQREFCDLSDVLQHHLAVVSIPQAEEEINLVTQ